MTRGWCPFATRRDTANFGYPKGTHDQNLPLFWVDHIMAGWKSTLDDPGWREPNGVGVHFGIGNDGSISQYTNIFDASWGNGVSGSKERYDRSNRHLAELEAQGTWVEVVYARTKAWALCQSGSWINFPNSRSISMEHEDFSDTPWTPEKLASSIRVKKWCIEELEREGTPLTIDADVLVRHAQIDGVNRAQCPGSAWPKATILVALQEDDMALTSDQEDTLAKLRILLGWLETPVTPHYGPGHDGKPRPLREQIFWTLLALDQQRFKWLLNESNFPDSDDFRGVFKAEVAAAVKSVLPATSGAGLTEAQIRAIVRQEIDKTGLKVT